MVVFDLQGRPVGVLDPIEDDGTDLDRVSVLLDDRGLGDFEGGIPRRDPVQRPPHRMNPANPLRFQRGDKLPEAKNDDLLPGVQNKKSEQQDRRKTEGHNQDQQEFQAALFFVASGGGHGRSQFCGGCGGDRPGMAT